LRLFKLKLQAYSTRIMCPLGNGEEKIASSFTDIITILYSLKQSGLYIYHLLYLKKLHFTHGSFRLLMFLRKYNYSFPKLQIMIQTKSCRI
jgi:hypothetical protein